MKKVGQIYRENLANRIKKSVEDSSSIFLISYSHISGPKMNDLRKSLRSIGADVFVSRNTIARQALKELKQETFTERLKGQTAFIWSKSDSAEISKVLCKFIKDCETVKLQGGLLDGRVLEFDDIKRLSELPSRQVLLSILLGTMQAPLTRLAGALNAKTQELFSILKQLQASRKE